MPTYAKTHKLYILVYTKQLFVVLGEVQALWQQTWQPYRYDFGKLLSVKVHVLCCSRHRLYK